MQPDPRHQRRTAWLRATYAVAFAWGIRAPFFPTGFEPIFFSIAAAIVATKLCVTDSHLIRRPIPWSLQWLIFVTWPIFLPIYFARTRGWRRLPRLIVYTLAYLATAYIPFLFISMLLGQETQ